MKDYDKSNTDNIAYFRIGGILGILFLELVEASVRIANCGAC